MKRKMKPGRRNKNVKENMARLRVLMRDNPGESRQWFADRMAEDGFRIKGGGLVNKLHVDYLIRQMKRRPYSKKLKPPTENPVFNLSAEKMDLPLAQSTKTDEELIAFIQIAMTLHMPAQRRIEIIRAALGVDA